jgi:hypothetical protein
MSLTLFAIISNVLALLVITARLSCNHSNLDRKFTLLDTRHIIYMVPQGVPGGSAETEGDDK